MEPSTISFWRSICSKLLVTAIACMAWSLLSDVVAVALPRFAGSSIIACCFLGVALAAIALACIANLGTWLAASDAALPPPGFVRLDFMLLAVLVTAVDFGVRMASAMQFSALGVFLSVLASVALIVVDGLRSDALRTMQLQR